MSNQKNELFRRFLDGELDADEEQRILHMIADDEEMREMLRFERTLYQAMGKKMDSESFSVPDGFTGAVMNRIASREAALETSPGLWEKLKEILSPLFLPQTIQLRPVYALVPVLVIVLPLFLHERNMETISGPDSQERSVQLISEQEQKVWIRFVFFDEEAETVSVAGDFSDWDPVSLDKELIDGRQVWSGLVPVSRGEQRYMFIKNGEEWVTDPLAEISRDDGFGNQNAVLFL